MAECEETMAMVVMNNSAAIMTLNELNKNTKKLSKSLQQAASGMQLNNAGDGAAEYAISERMRVQIRGLSQAKDNSETGSSLLRVAEGGIQNIIDNMKTMKELALRSANDIYTDADREAMQKEWNAHVEEIDDVAATTNYNGKVLLDGTYRRNIGGITVLTEPLTDRGILANGDVTIAQTGIYTIPDGYSGTITVTSNNVELKQQGTSAVAAKIVCSNEHTALWLNAVNMNNTDGSTMISFTGSNNSLHLMGSNTLTRSLDLRRVGIDIGTGLTICDDGNAGSLTANFWGGSSSVSACVIGSSTKTGYLDIDSGTLNIGSSGSSDNIGDVENLTIYGGTVNTGVGAGSACAGIGTVKGGTLTINGGTVNAFGFTGIGGLGNVIINAGTVTAHGIYGAAIGSNDGVNSNISGGGDITINGGTVVAIEKAIDNDVYYGGAGIGSGAGNYCGNITFNGGIVTAQATDTLHGAADIGKGADSENRTSTTGVIAYHAGIINGIDYGPYTEKVFKAPELTLDSTVLNDPLHFQTSTKASDDLRCFIEDMHSSALGLNGVNVLTRQNASAAIDKMDGALDYALAQNTDIGAMIMRMDFTANNLTIASENVMSAESVVRDADMAKTMTEYAKNNVLSQAAQSMLAQANQESSSVLSLLK